MTIDRPDSAALFRALRRTHLSVLGTLVLCALLIVLHGFEGEEPPPSPLVTTWGIGLGLVAIAARQLATSPRLGPRPRVFCMLGSLLAGACLGLLGVYMAYALESPESGILFTLAGLIFSARPPAHP